MLNCSGLSFRLPDVWKGVRRGGCSVSANEGTEKEGMYLHALVEGLISNGIRASDVVQRPMTLVWFAMPLTEPPQ